MTTREYNLSVDEYSDDIFRFILKNIKDEEKAKDIVQETYTKLWTKTNNVSFEKVKSYLFSTAYHTMIDGIRKEKLEIDYTAIKSTENQNTEEYFDLKEILNVALSQLPEIQRSVLLLRDYEGYSYKEIEEICDINQSQVKVYIYRARLAIKHYIGSLEKVI